MWKEEMTESLFLMFCEVILVGRIHITDLRAWIIQSCLGTLKIYLCVVILRTSFSGSLWKLWTQRINFFPHPALSHADPETYPVSSWPADIGQLFSGSIVRSACDMWREESSLFASYSWKQVYVCTSHDHSLFFHHVLFLYSSLTLTSFIITYPVTLQGVCILQGEYDVTSINASMFLCSDSCSDLTVVLLGNLGPWFCSGDRHSKWLIVSSTAGTTPLPLLMSSLWHPPSKPECWQFQQLLSLNILDSSWV